MCMPVHMHVCVCAVRDSIQETVDDIREEDAAATLCMIFYFSCLNDSEWVHSPDQQSLFLAFCHKIWHIILLINTVPWTFILLHLHDYKWWCLLKQCAYIFVCVHLHLYIHVCVLVCFRMFSASSILYALTEFQEKQVLKCTSHRPLVSRFLLFLLAVSTLESIFIALNPHQFLVLIFSMVVNG